VGGARLLARSGKPTSTAATQSPLSWARMARSAWRWTTPTSTGPTSRQYWTDIQTGTIMEANLDGTNPQAIVTGQNSYYVAVGPQ